ncbi:adhesion G-protein coupled receptor F3 [Alligator mississippiensis]|uniref:adhesion G-protein coupled receptor F3 n=1 Tax=Alligator mississippiensis TaxID=8496 RepID=UPI002877924C|nr:adhesion G-protein coupled receptor F3 [Alligator mississippiensis]
MAMDRTGLLLPCFLLLAASCQLRDLREDVPSASPGGEHVSGSPRGRARRAADTVSVAAYVRLTLLVSGATSSAQLQLLFGAVPMPKPLASLAGNVTAMAITTDAPDSTLAPQATPAGGTLTVSVTNETPAGGTLTVLAPNETPTGGAPLVSILPPVQTSAGVDLTLSFPLGPGAADVQWLLLGPGGGLGMELHNGTQVTLVVNGSEAILRVTSVSSDWAGLYVCQYIIMSTWHQLQQRVVVAPSPADLAQTPAQVSMNCSSAAGLALQCCIRNTGQAYSVAWSPGPAQPEALMGDTDPLCHTLVLATCPSQDTTYQCTFTGEGPGSAHSLVTVSVIQAGDLFCPQDRSRGTWGTTKAGRVAETWCPEGSAGIVRRTCTPEGTWGAMTSQCTSQELLAGLRRARLLLAGLGSPRRDLADLIEWLQWETDPSRGLVNSSLDLLALATVADTIAHIAMDTGTRLNHSSVASFLVAASQLLDVSTMPLWSEAQAWVPSLPSRFLQAIEGITGLLHPMPGNFSLALPNLELQGATLEPTALSDYDKAFATRPPLRVHIAKAMLEALVPPGANVTVTSMVLKTLGAVLPGHYAPDLGNGSFTLASLVLANAIVANNGSVSQAQINMTFGHREGLGDRGGQTPQCVFWDHRLFEGAGGWSSEGCRATDAGPGAATRCLCQHLTSFSILMSTRHVADGFWLSFLSQLGVCASIVALLLCLSIYRLAWPTVVRSKVSYFRYMTLVQICLSLLLGNLWFVGGARLAAEGWGELCMAAAFFMHFFYLATFFWMLVQAVMIFHQLVFVFHQLARASVTPFMVTVGYLCPLAIAVATVAVYQPRQQYLHPTACWLSGYSGAVYAFSGPVLLVVLANLLILFVVVMKLMRPSVSEGPPADDRKALLGILKALLVLTPVFGLTWGLGAATMAGDSSRGSHYTFSILNSLQGVFILVFGCLLDKKVREALLRRLHKLPSVRAGLSQSKSDGLDPKPGH